MTFGTTTPVLEPVSKVQFLALKRAGREYDFREVVALHTLRSAVLSLADSQIH